jgi:hypothetical protein
MSKAVHDRIGRFVGTLTEVNCSPGSMLVFQLPRPTDQLSDVYIAGAIRSSLPDGHCALVIGSDVNIYELSEGAAVLLKLKGQVG